MKISALKTLAVSILVSGIVALGFAAPAHAVTGSASVHSFTAGSAAGVTFSTGTITASAISRFDVKIYNNANQPTTFTPVAGCSTFATCHVTSFKLGGTTFTSTGTVGTITVAVLGTVAPNNYSQSHLEFSFSGTGVAVSSNSIEVVLDSGALTAPNTNGTYTFSGYLNASSTTEYTDTVTVTGAPTRVSFFRNYSNMDFTRTTQDSVVRANLTQNTFTRSGYYFTGWATSDSGPVVYQDQESFSFASPTMLYAVWSTTPPVSTASASSSPGASVAASGGLASTGSDSAGVIATGVGLVGLGVVALALLQVVRYRRRQH